MPALACSTQAHTCCVCCECWIKHCGDVPVDEVVSTCRLLDKQLEPEVLNSIVAEAVEIEREFICESLPCNLIGMNADYMKARAALRLQSCLSTSAQVARRMLCCCLSIACSSTVGIWQNEVALSQNIVGALQEYIEFVADRLLCSLGGQKMFNTNNPFSWMEQISLQCAPHHRAVLDSARTAPMHSTNAWHLQLRVLHIGRSTLSADSVYGLQGQNKLL